MPEASNNQKQTKEEEKKDFVEKVVARLKAEHTLFRDQSEDPYIAIDKMGDKIMKLNSREFAHWLKNWIISNYHMFSGLNDRIETITAMLLYEAEMNGEKRELSTRMHRIDDSNGNPIQLDYDLHNNAQTVRVTPSGWEVISSPISFYQWPHQKAQCVPQKHSDRSIEPLRELISEVKDDGEFLVLMVYIVSIFLPNSPTPLLSLFGSQGAGKSETAHRIVELCDPSSFEQGLPPIKNSQELLRLSNKVSILFMDNLSSISPSLSDSLCRLVSGSSMAKRSLYSDNNDFFIEVTRPVIITSIPQSLFREDLLDRSIPLKVNRIPDEKRMTKAELNAKFQALKPYLLGSVFNIISSAMKLLPTVKLNGLKRMSDWTKVGWAIAESMDGHTGQEFLDAYQRIIDRQAELAVESSLVCQACRLLVSQTGTWSGTASELHMLKLVHEDYEHGEDYEDRCQLINNPDWPRTPATLGKQLERAKSTLESIGIKVDNKHYRFGQRSVTLTDTRWTESNNNKSETKPENTN